MNFEYLSKIEENVNTLEDLKAFYETSQARYHQMIEIQQIVQKLKQNPTYSRILQVFKECEKVEVMILIAREIKNIENISSSLEIAISKNHNEAFTLLQRLERIKTSIDWVDEIVLYRIDQTKSSLTPIFTEELGNTLTESHWPFHTKGEIISLRQETLNKLKDLLEKLIYLKNIEYISEILVHGMIEQISFHFLSDKSTNKIDRPEWMLNYSVNLLKISVCHLLETFGMSYKVIDYILQFSVTQILEIVSKRIFYDTKTSIQSKKELLFLHIIDEVLKFDVALNELRSKKFLLQKFMTPDLINVWIPYENTYISAEIAKILSESSWGIEKISGMKYNNMNEVILLHNSLMIKYSNVFDDKIKEKLIDNMNNILIKMFVDVYSERFSCVKTFMFHYVTNPELWSQISLQMTALHQSLVLFQQFLLNISKDSFAEFHLNLNLLKKEIIGKYLQFVLLTIEEIVGEYITKANWKQKEGLSTKLIKKIIETLRKSSTQDLSKLILSYTSQKISEIIVKSLKTKTLKPEHQKNAAEDFKEFFTLLEDDTDRYSLVMSTIIKN